MSGFFVSNNLGTFSAEGKTPKVFKADIEGWPTAPQTATLIGLMGGQPTVDGDNANIWAWSNFHLKHGGKGTVPTGSENADHEEFFKFSNGSTSGDKVVLYRSEAWSFSPKAGTTSKFNVKYVTNDKNTSNAYDYVVNIKKETISLPTAAISSLPKYSCFSNYIRDDANGYCSFDVTLDGDDSSYFSVDMNKNSNAAANSVYNTACGKWMRVDADGSDDPYDKDIDRVEIKWLSIVKNPTLGCTTSSADNYNSNADKEDGSCRYTTSPITKFAVTPTAIKTGESVNINWEIAGTNFTEVQCLMNGTNIMDPTLKGARSQNFDYTITSAGTKDFELVVKWDLAGTGGDVKSSKKTVNVVTTPSYIPCTDPNRAVDGNGECAACNSNYYLDGGLCKAYIPCTDPNRAKDGNQQCAACNSGYYLGTDGLCTTCADPNMNTDSNGRCTTCLSGYTLHTDGTCQKVGCMTYADGASASDDYNYDPDAVVNDSTMCQGADPVEPDLVPEMIDCELSDWGDWSEFTEWSDAATASGTRTRTRNRTIVTNVSGGGATCGELEETETETGELDPDTGEVTTITTSTGDTTPVTPTTTPSPVIPIILGVAALGVLALLMRR